MIQSSRWWKLETTSQGAKRRSWPWTERRRRCRVEEILDTDLHNFYLQISALILEILQPLVVEFLVVSHVSRSGCVQNRWARGFSSLAAPFWFPFHSLSLTDYFLLLSAVHTGNAGGGGQPRSGVEEGWGNPLHSHWLHCEHLICRARHITRYETHSWQTEFTLGDQIKYLGFQIL